MAEFVGESLADMEERHKKELKVRGRAQHDFLVGGPSPKATSCPAGPLGGTPVAGAVRA